MEILGYSERGVLNSFFYEMRYAQNAVDLMDGFLGRAVFPYDNVHLFVKDITILIEQSFSDFGDADAVLLVDNDEMKQTVFIEAKVKTFEKKWDINEEFKRFKEGVSKGKVSSSNLFTQLYHKIRLFDELKSGGREKLEKGISFPECSSKSKRRIGKNEVVLKALDKIAQFTDRAFYVALVPGRLEDVLEFFLKKLENNYLSRLDGWKTINWGFITWEAVEKFCAENNLRAALNVFDHNRGQIY
ncbi:MAG: hypothetical protein ACTSRC_22070 [Candidatus Helarchaeota archaeon]